MDFTPITTQEQLDALIGERLKRDREQQAKRYEGWMKPEDAQQLQTQIEALTKAAEGHKQAVADYEAKIRGYEAASVKSRIADEVGLDRRLVSRLTGETEEEIRKDAEGLKAILGERPAAQPGVDVMRSTEPKMGADMWAIRRAMGLSDGSADKKG